MLKHIPLVSVIIPAYNCARYLPDAIASALQQTHPRVEIVVVNDGSPDNTDEVVQPYLDRITYIKQENRGLSAARNVGFRASHGEFVCFLDTDDILLPDKFTLQLSKFEREPDLGVVISGYVDVEEDGQTEILAVKKNWDRDALERMFNHEVFPPHTAVIRRSVLEASPLFPEDIDTNESQEDWQLWLDMALNGVKFSSVPESTCKYRNRPGSIRTNPLKHFDGARRVVSWLRQHPQAQIYKERVERLAAIVEMERVAVAWRISRADLAGENLVAAVRQSPDFWREPTTYLRLFERSLTLSESAQWKRAHDPVWFEATVLGMLHLAGQELSMSELRQLRASVYLASSDLAYSMGNDVQRIRAVRLALQNSLFICLSKRGSTSVMRGFLGPKIPSGLSNLRARTGLEH
jgi:glycosyltransferase involved in cell wall biosynthesis